MHCHPCLKIYLCNKSIAEKHHPIPDILPSGMHVDLPGMKKANVQVAFCSHYVPEAGLGQLPKSAWVFRLLKKLRLNIIDKFEPPHTDGAYVRALWSIFQLNQQIRQSPKKFNVTVARNLSEFQEAYDTGKKIILHCLEGAHQLGKGLANPDDYIHRLNYLKQEGVCLLTISHFFQNDIADSGGGIPPSTARLVGYSKPASTSNGLTQIGKLVVEWCQEHGIIIDLVHSTVEARKQVYDILEDRISRGLKTRPVVFSHSGIRELAGSNMPDPHDPFILPDLRELELIKKYDGVIGMILMNYWVIGIEEDNILKNDTGIKHLIKTIECISRHLGDFKNIAIGTDLDGFTQVPDDVTHVRRMGRVREAISRTFGETAAQQICYENALRVIRCGWS